MYYYSPFRNEKVRQLTKVLQVVRNRADSNLAAMTPLDALWVP